MVTFGVTVVVGALVLVAVRGRGRAGPGWSRTDGLEARPVPHPRSPLSRRCWSPGMIKATNLLPDGKPTCATVDRVKRYQASLSSTGHHPAALNITDWYRKIFFGLNT